MQQNLESDLFCFSCLYPANKIRLWNKGVDSESFHPRYRSHEMRLRLRFETLVIFCFLKVLVMIGFHLILTATVNLRNP